MNIETEPAKLELSLVFPMLISIRDRLHKPRKPVEWAMVGGRSGGLISRMGLVFVAHFHSPLETVRATLPRHAKNA